VSASIERMGGFQRRAIVVRCLPAICQLTSQSMLRNHTPLCAAISMVALTVLVAETVRAETWNLGTGSSWNTATNWNPSSVPNDVGASAIFNWLATPLNPDQEGNRSITLDGAKTVGSILFNNDLGTFTNSITTGTGGPLTFDAAGTGTATITTTGSGTGNNTINVATVLTDSLNVFVDNISAASAAGSLNLLAAISGPGGFTK